MIKHTLNGHVCVCVWSKAFVCIGLQRTHNYTDVLYLGMIEPSHSLHTDEPRVIGTMMGDGIASDVSIKKIIDLL